MKIPKRGEIDTKYKWDLNSMFTSDEAWETAFEDFCEKKDSLISYKGQLGDDKKLLQCFKQSDELDITAENLYVYASLKNDEDKKVTKYQGMRDRMEMTLVEVSSKNSFIMPEIMEKRSEENMIALSTKVEFAEYSYKLQEMARLKKIIKSEKEEKIISEVGMFSSGFKNIFSCFDNTDIEFKDIRDENGKMTEMSHGNYSLFMQSPDRKVRKSALVSMFTPYKHYTNTISAVYGGNLKQDYFYAKLRGFDSCMEYAMHGENVSPIVYESLIAAVHNEIPTLSKYMKYRKSALGLKTLETQDLYVPIVSGADIKISYEDACKMVKNALEPMGEDYLQLLDKAFADGWIDVFENKYKRSGAYSWGTFTSKPYVLLNYTKTTHDVFTIAHELGHSMHSYYSKTTQPYAKANYEIFVAEVASTVNEVLLLKHLIKNAEGETKKYLLSYYLEMFRTTVFRQTMFAEFEKLAHEMVENGEPATSEALSDCYYKLNQLYYPTVKNDKLIAYEWSRIPHFYNSFYVYKYATGLISAVFIAENILAGNNAVISGYKEFLKAGGSMKPEDILKLAGVDLTKKESYAYAFDSFAKTVKELLKL